MSIVEENGTTGEFYQKSLYYGFRVGTIDRLTEKVKVEGSKVMFEFIPGSLEAGKKLLVSVGREPKIKLAEMEGSFIVQNGFTPSFEQLKDPAGNDIEAGSTSTSAKIEVSGVQRVTTIN